MATGKMKFFVVQKNGVIEYTETNKCAKKWMEPSSLNAVQMSDADYYNKVFPLEVLKKINRENIRKRF